MAIEAPPADKIIFVDCRRTSVAVRLDSDFNSDNSTVGELLPATVVTPLTSDGNVVVQRGSSAQLKVVKIDKSGKISGKSHVEFALVGLTAHGKLMHISGSSKACGRTVARRTDRGENGHRYRRGRCHRRHRWSPVSSCRHRGRGWRGRRGSDRRINLAPCASKGQCRDRASVSLDQGHSDGVLAGSRAYEAAEELWTAA